MSAIPELMERVRLDNCCKMKALLLTLEDLLKHIPENDNKAYPGKYIFEIFAKGASITHANYNIFIKEVRKVIDLLRTTVPSKNKGPFQLDNFCKCLQLVFGETTEAQCLAKAQSYRVYVSNTHSGTAPPNNTTDTNTYAGGRTLSYEYYAPSGKLSPERESEHDSEIETTENENEIEHPHENEIKIKIEHENDNNIPSSSSLADHSITPDVIDSSDNNRLVRKLHDTKMEMAQVELKKAKTTLVEQFRKASEVETCRNRRRKIIQKVDKLWNEILGDSSSEEDSSVSNANSNTDGSRS